MKLIGNYKEDIRELIQGTNSYSMPDDIFIPDPEVPGEPRPLAPPVGYNPTLGQLANVALFVIA